MDHFLYCTQIDSLFLCITDKSMATTCHTHTHTDSLIITNIKCELLIIQINLNKTCTKQQDSKLQTSPHVL